MAILIGIGSVVPFNAQAIPAFARKYGFNCTMCHTAFTKLNDFGQRFRDNGYQIPGQQGKEKNVFNSTIPLAMRLSLGSTIYNNPEGTAASFNLYGFDLLAGGVLHKNISFILIYTPPIDIPSSQYPGSDDHSPSQWGSLESVSLVFSNIIKDALNLRIGRFEPAYHVFSSKRSFYLFEPYEIYDFTTPNNGYAFSDNQIGIEASGHFPFGFKYAAGVVNGTGGDPDNNNAKDIYLNLVQTIGKGDGQSAGQRIGLFGYYGWQPLEVPGKVVGTSGQTNGEENNAFYRIGATASLNYKSANLQAMYFVGADDKAFNAIDPTKNYKFTGGLLELDYAALSDNRLVASVMYNWTRPPSYDPNLELNAYSLLLRYYPGGWSGINIAIHGEYTNRVTGDAEKNKENIFALGLDFAL